MNYSSRQGSFIQWALLVYGLIICTIILGGALFFSNLAREARLFVEVQLTSIGELKVAQLLQWRDERLDDAFLILKSPNLIDDLGALILNPHSPTSNLTNFF